MKKFAVTLVAIAVFVGMTGVGAFAQKKSVEDMFANLDKNGDKKLSAEEFVGNRTGQKADAANAMFKRADKNKDGSVTLDEFKAARKGGGKKKKDS